MRQYFDFSRLIKKYGKEIPVLIPTEGFYDDAGDWQPTTEQKTLFGAIINHRENKIFRAEGKVTAEDRALYMLEPVENSLHGAKLIEGDKIYSIGDELQNGEFTGVWAYTLKYNSAFKGKNADYDLTEQADKLNKCIDGKLGE